MLQRGFLHFFPDVVSDRLSVRPVQIGDFVWVSVRVIALVDNGTVFVLHAPVFKQLSEFNLHGYLLSESPDVPDRYLLRRTK